MISSTYRLEKSGCPYSNRFDSAESTSCSQTSTDSELVSTPRTFCRSHLQRLLGSEVAQKIMELRKLLVDGADCRPIDVLDDLCRSACCICDILLRTLLILFSLNRLLQENGGLEVHSKLRPALVDVAVQSDINFDETGLATDFSIDPVDLEDDAAHPSKETAQNEGWCHPGRSATLSQFSWRDASRRNSQEGNRCRCADQQHRSLRQEVEPPSPWPLILHQSIASVGRDDGGSGTARRGSTDVAHLPGHEPQTWDESFLLGAMRRAGAGSSWAGPLSPPTPCSPHRQDSLQPPPRWPAGAHPMHTEQDRCEPQAGAAPPSEWPSLVASAVVSDAGGDGSRRAAEYRRLIL